MAGLLDNRQALGAGLLSAGGAMMQGGQRGLLGSLGQGLQGFAQGRQGFLDQERQSQLYDLQLAGLQRQERQAALTEEQRQQMAQSVEDYLSKNQLPPEIDGLVRARVAGGDQDGALKIAADYVMQTPDAPKTVGGMMWTGSEYAPIPGYTEQASAIAQAGRNQAPELPKTMEERDRQILLTGDPSSPEYELAYANLFLNPRMVQGEQGIVPIMPVVPQGVRQPASMSGGAQPTVGSTIPGTFKPTEGQGLSAGYASRMAEAEPIIQQYEDVLASGTETLRANLPIVGNYAASSEYQEGYQAASDWVRAKLRKESGAVIGEDEMAEEIRQYFPQPGDGPEVIAQKRRARETAIQAMQKQAGPAGQGGGQPQPGEPTAMNAQGDILVFRNGQWVTP
jgi:hypothetical protein